MVITPDFWQDRRVLLTGHTGFKGGWLALWLQRMQAKVVGFALPPATQPSLFELAQVGDHMTSVIGDVRRLDPLQQMLAQHQPEIIFHLAAQALVLESYRDPVGTYATNVMGTVHLLEAVRRTPSVRAVVIVTSDKCYENREWLWGYREDEPMGGHDPYSNSKGCAELVTAAYRNSFFPPSTYDQHGVAVASARAGNVIGGGDWAADRLVPDIIRSLVANRPVLLRNPLAIRPWQHVLEPLAGYLMLAEALYQHGPAFAEGWNFGPDEDASQPVQRVVETMLAHWGSHIEWQQDPEAKPHEAHSLKLDCSKARHRLGWQPRLTLNEAISWVVEWTQAWQRHEDMRRVTLDQIARYMERLCQTSSDHRGVEL